MGGTALQRGSGFRRARVPVSLRRSRGRDWKESGAHPVDPREFGPRILLVRPFNPTILLHQMNVFDSFSDRGLTGDGTLVHWYHETIKKEQ